MVRTLFPVFFLMSLALVLPVHAQKAKTPTPPWKNPNAAALVQQGKLPPFYDPNNLAKVPIISAPSAIVIDADSGRVLYEKNADVRREPASLTKMMTALLLVENTEPGEIITCIDPKIQQIPESSLHIQPWEKFTVENLVRGFMVRSGNDAGVVIAQHIAGSVPKFAAMMNARAAEIGATHTNFVNAHGWHTEGHYSTARDLALIAREAMKNSRFAEAVSSPRVTIERSKNQTDTNIVSRMMGRFHKKMVGADGIKTGYTRQAGYCYAGSATRNGQRLISVVLGARGGSAIDDSVVLQSWSFRRFRPESLVRKGEAVGTVPIQGGAVAQITAVADADLRVLLDTTANELPIQTELKAEPVVAPVEAGTVIGRVVAKQGEQVLGEVIARAGAAVAASPVRIVRATMAPVVNWFLPATGGAALVLIGWHYYGTATAKNSGRRRNRLAPTRRGDDRGRSNHGGRGTS